MNALNLSRRGLHLPFIALSLLVLSACSGIDSVEKMPPQIFNDFPESAEYLLKQAETVDQLKSTDWELVAVQALIKEKKYILANSVIEHLQKKNLTATQKNDLQLLIADNQYAQNQLLESFATLESIDPTLLSPAATIRYYKLKIDLLVRDKKHQQAVDALLVFTPLITIDEEKQQYNDLLFTQLTLLDPEVLNQFATATLDTDSAENSEATSLQNDETSTEKTEKSPVSKEDAFAAELAAIEAEMTQESVTEPTTVQLTDDEIFVQGWYALASLYQRYQFRTNQLLRGVDTWKLIYPSHPALDFMPTPLRDIPASSPYQPTKVAVLLPLTGRFKQPAKALQYGISHAYYTQSALKKQRVIEEKELADNMAQLVAQNERVTTGIAAQIVKAENENAILASANHTDNEPEPSLVFFDTNVMSMQEIAEQLHNQRIEFVIGPLLKPNLELFLPLVKDIPVLALNGFPTEPSTDTNDEPELTGSSLHYAFPLSPESEAEQAAEIIFQNKHKKPLVFAPKSKFGERVSAAFEARWATLNAAQKIKSDNGLESYSAETHLFTSKGQLAKFIDNAMQTNKSKQRNYQMKAIIDEPVETAVRSRRDVDAIYLIGKRSELILLKPFIAVSISPFANRIPLYASSRSHDADLTNTQNKELTGLTFSDIAFLMDDEAQINQEVQAIWPKQRFSTLRLFALGFDSYNLIEQLKQLQVIEGQKFQGLVGELSLDRSNTLKSRLQWAKYQEGSLIEVTAPISSQ